MHLVRARARARVRARVRVTQTLALALALAPPLPLTRCTRCLLLRPEFEAAANLLYDADPPVALATINIDDPTNLPLIERFGVLSFPVGTISLAPALSPAPALALALAPALAPALIRTPSLTLALALALALL